MLQQQLMPSILDREITAKADDAFGHQDFADALQSLVEAEHNHPPYSIGLLGSWGTGKSTIKSFYLHDLSDDTAKSSGFKKRSERIKAMTFNAWRYGGSADGNMKRALLRHVFIGLGGSQKNLKDELYHQINKNYEKARSWKATLWDWVCKIFLNLLPTIVFFVVFLVALYLVTKGLSVDNDWAKVLLATVSAFFSGWLIKAFGVTALTPIHTTKIELPRTSAEEYEELLIKQIYNFKKKNGAYQRIVIFIDDLDRLSANEMVDGLDAIRTFMEIPEDNLPYDLGIVFVISCDENRIAEALNKGRHKNSDMPGAVFTKDDACKYLDRIFQFRLEIPPFPKQDMREFALRHLRSAAPDLIDDIESNGCKLGNIIDRLIHVDVDNPRNALQLVNSFIQSWWLAKKREFAGAGTQRPGGLSEGIVTRHPITLAIVSALKVNYPRFYQELLREPELVHYFTSCFIQDKTKFTDLPPRAQYLLSEVRRGKDWGKDKDRLRPEHDALRRFIGSLRGHRWPISLLPFILLTQDAVSRKFSGRATYIHDALVSSDVEGYLRELGRDKDSKPISLDDARLTADIIEDLEGESEVRRNNAVYVIAAVSTRIPNEIQSRLLPPICRQLELTREFRSQVGVKKISEVIMNVHPDYQKDIVHLLLEDTCGADNFSLSLTTGQPPSLDEACQVLEQVVELALAIWEKQGLQNATRELLSKWMLDREVRLSDKESVTLPFSKLDEWVRFHKALLLPEFRENYTDQLIGELENNRIEDIDGQCLAFCREVFNGLKKAGEDDRPVLWEHLSRMVGVRPVSPVAFAWEYANQYGPKANKKSVSQFLQAFCERLYQDMTEEGWEIENWDEGAKVLLQIANSRSDSLDQDVCKKIGQLSESYVIDENTSKYSTQLLDILTGQDSPEAKPVIMEMISHLLDKLPKTGVEWLATHYAMNLEDTERESIKAKMEELVSNVGHVTAESISPYGRFLATIQPAGWESTMIQTHISNAFTLLQQNHSSFDPYIKLLFPVLLTALPNIQEATIGQNLTALFQNLQSQPQALAWLHFQIKGRWPEETYPGLNVTQIAETSITTSSAHAQIPHMGELLLSLWNLQELGLLPQDTYEQQLVALACTLWPYHQEAASNVLMTATIAADGDSISLLAENVKLDNDGALKILQDVWGHITTILTDADIDKVTKQVLAIGPKGTELHPDLILQIWIDSIPAEKNRKSIEGLLTEENLQDEYVERIWRLIVQQMQKYEVDFFARSIPLLCANSALNRTHKAIIELSGVLADSFNSQAEKNTLSEGLLLAVIKSSSLEDKRALAQRLSDTGGATKLSNLRNHEGELDVNTFDVLIETFPSHRKKIEKLKYDLFLASSE